MDIAELKKMLKSKNLTYAKLSELSKVPLQTIQKVFSGQTAHPRIDTMQAIERALGLADNSPLENAKIGETLTDKEKRLLRAFNTLVEPMQDIMLEQMEKMAKVRETV